LLLLQTYAGGNEISGQHFRQLVEDRPGAIRKYTASKRIDDAELNGSIK
jgi:hypothetical protein